MRISDGSSDVCSSDLHRLAEHRRLGLDAADAPAEHAEAVDHRRVAVGADAGVGISDGLAVRILARPHRLRDLLEVDLVADAGARGSRLEIVQALRPPFPEVLALAIAVILDLDIALDSLGGAEFVAHDRLVDAEVAGDQWLHLRLIAANLG